MKQNKDFILREVAGEYVMIPTGEASQQFNGMITLNATAAFVWKHVEEVPDFQGLVDMILENYEVDDKMAAADTANMLNRMLAARRIFVSDTEKGW